MTEQTTTMTATKMLDAIADRAVAIMVREYGDSAIDEEAQWRNVRQTIACCHRGPCALDLDALLAADDFNFCHDVFGILRHFNGRKLTGCFDPRFHKRD